MYKSISVFFPAYNEEENIKDAVLSVDKFLKKHFKKYEIIVVDDGSRDNTAKIVRDIARKSLHVRLVQHKRNQGYGAALRTGFKSAKNELIFYTDADNQFKISDFEKVLPLIYKYDIVSGFRIKRQDPLVRIITSNVYNLIINVLFNPKIRDIDASFKLYKKSVIDNLKLKSNTGLIDAEVFIKARKKGFTIGQIGVKHYPRLHGKTIYEVGGRNKIIAFVRPKVVVDIFSEINKLWPELR
jgi:dolichol-phosphate mannosyltransferase